MQSLEHRQAAFFSYGAQLSKSLRTVVAATPVATIISDPRLPDNPIIAVNQTFIDLTATALRMFLIAIAGFCQAREPSLG
jgi:hypothetical protein